MRWLSSRGIRPPCWTQLPQLVRPYRPLFFSDTVVAQSRWTRFLPASGACRARMQYRLEAEQLAETSEYLASGPPPVSEARKPE